MGRQTTTTSQLQDLGLTPAEAKAYAFLLREGSSSGQAIASGIGVTRSTTYRALEALKERELIETGEGWGSLFDAVSPEIALPGLVDRERVALTAQLDERERLAKELAQALEGTLNETGGQDGDVVEVIRGRRAVVNRFNRLQVTVEARLDMFVKAPLVIGSGNQVLFEALARGVQVRCLYEEAILDDPYVGPYLEQWSAAGEQARVHRGQLPFKLAVFDSRSILLPLETPQARHALTTILIRHEPLGYGFRVLFEQLWANSQEMLPESSRPKPGPTAKMSRANENRRRT